MGVATPTGVPQAGGGRGQGHGAGRGGRGINWLAPRSPGQIRQQALKTISSAYAPAYENLDQQGKQAQGLADKRSADNQYYNSWLQTQMDTLQSHADAAHATLLGMEQNLTNQQNQLYSQQPQTLVDRASQRPGNVSNESQSNAFGEDLHQNEIANQETLSGSAKSALEGIDLSNSQLGASRNNDFSYLQAVRLKQDADLQSVMSKIDTARLGLQSKETGDIGKEIARLSDVEMQKAQSNRNFAAVAQRLGIEQANTNSEIGARAQAAQTAATNAQTNQQRLAQTKFEDSIRNTLGFDRYNLDKSRLDQQTAKDMYERQNHLGPYRNAKGAAALTPRSQQVIVDQIGKTRSTLEQLTHYYGDRSKAWHAMHQGFYIAHDGKMHTLSGLGAGGGNQDGYLNAAYNTMANVGTGLSPGDVHFLTGLGLSNPAQQLG